MSEVTLADVAHVIMGQSPDGTTYNKTRLGTPLLNGPAEFGPINPIAVQWTTEPTKIALPGDILFCVRGNTLGRQNIADQEYVIGRGLAAIRARQSQADTDYIGLWLKLKADELLAAGNGSTFPSVSGDFLEAQLFPEIGAEEQRQIAARLKAQLAEVETARQAAQVQLRDARLLGTKIVDSVFEQFEDWHPIAEIAKVQSGYAFKSESFRSSGVRLLRNANILPGEIYWDDTVYLDPSEASRYPSYVLEEGDVLISLDRPLISSGIKVARVGAADLPALLLQRVGRFVLKPNEIDADFLYAFLQSSRFIDAISGHDQSLGVPHISPGQVESVEIPLLPLDDQRRIVAHLKQQLTEADALRAALENQQRDLDALPQRILAQAFNPQGESA